jgi:hypothetical protein
MTAVADDNSFRVAAYMVHNQAIERHEFQTRPNGAIEHRFSILKRDLPLVYGSP